MLKILLNEKITHSLLSILILILIYCIFNTISKRMFKLNIKTKKIQEKKHKTIWSFINNIVKYFLIFVGIIMVLGIQGVDTRSLIASLGVASAIVALAFQDTLKDLFAGILIVLENQYNIGDTVEINNFKGEVMAVGLRTTTLKSYTGEYCFIANRNVDKVINYSMSRSLAIVNVDVSYDSDLDKVEKVLSQLFIQIQDKIKSIRGDITIDGVDELGSSGITIRIVAPTLPLKNFEVERQLRKEIKKAFDENNIEIPYPQVVVHND